MECSFRQDMVNTFKNPLHLWLPTQEQAKSTSTGRTTWTQQAINKGKGGKESAGVWGVGIGGLSRVHRTKMMFTCIKLSKNKSKIQFFK